MQDRYPFLFFILWCSLVMLTAIFAMVFIGHTAAWVAGIFPRFPAMPALFSVVSFLSLRELERYLGVD